jgi:hypothetical protein
VHVHRKAASARVERFLELRSLSIYF